MKISLQFKLRVNDTRVHSLKLYKNSFERDVGKYKFSNRVLDEWNHLNDDTAFGYIYFAKFVQEKT